MLICITVSTNYSDILQVILSQNLKFIDKWFIITSKSDNSTVNLIQNNDKIVVLYYDFQNDNNTFDKGGAIKMAQEHIYGMYSECLILLLDSDIYLPNNFLHVIMNLLDRSLLKANILFHPKKRLDFYKLSDFYEKTNYFDYPWMTDFQGFFQLYYHDTKMNNTNYLYQTSHNCSSCDLLFKNQFCEKEHIDIAVYHLGKNGVNWNGRKEIDFVIDTEIKN